MDLKLFVFVGGGLRPPFSRRRRRRCGVGFKPASRRAGSADAFGPATPLFYIYIWPWVYSLYHEPFIPYDCNHYQPGNYMYLILYHKFMWIHTYSIYGWWHQPLSRRRRHSAVDAVGSPV